MVSRFVFTETEIQSVFPDYFNMIMGQLDSMEQGSLLKNFERAEEQFRESNERFY